MLDVISIRRGPNRGCGWRGSSLVPLLIYVKWHVHMILDEIQPLNRLNMFKMQWHPRRPVKGNDYFD
jgi:hypothetical protein